MSDNESLKTWKANPIWEFLAAAAKIWNDKMLPVDRCSTFGKKISQFYQL